MNRKDCEILAKKLGAYQYYLLTNQNIQTEFVYLIDAIKDYLKNKQCARFTIALDKSFYETKIKDDSKNTYASTYKPLSQAHQEGIQKQQEHRESVKDIYDPDVIV